MAYSVKSKKSNKTYYLHAKNVKLAGGRIQKIFFFAGDIRDGSLDALPEGYEVTENARTGLPMLRKDKSAAPKGSSAKGSATATKGKK